jgi:hypothetical protein
MWEAELQGRVEPWPEVVVRGGWGAPEKLLKG